VSLYCRELTTLTTQRDTDARDARHHPKNTRAIPPTEPDCGGQWNPGIRWSLESCSDIFLGQLETRQTIGGVNDLFGTYGNYTALGQPQAIMWRDGSVDNANGVVTASSLRQKSKALSRSLG
jgi:hypothetical protein